MATPFVCSWPRGQNGLLVQGDSNGARTPSRGPKQEWGSQKGQGAMPRARSGARCLTLVLLPRVPLAPMVCGEFAGAGYLEATTPQDNVTMLQAGAFGFSLRALGSTIASREAWRSPVTYSRMSSRTLARHYGQPGGCLLSSRVPPAPCDLRLLPWLPWHSMPAGCPPQLYERSHAHAGRVRPPHPGRQDPAARAPVRSLPRENGPWTPSPFSS